MTTQSLLARGRAGETLADLDIVDMHGHVGAYDFAIPGRTPEAMVAAMDRIGVRQILCSHMACITGQVETGNREMLEAMRACPGRILGYATVWPESAEAVEAETRHCLDAGFTGVKLHNANGFPYDDPAYAPALALANERRRPVLFHTWGQPAEMAQVRRLSARYPSAALLLGHSGMNHPEEYVQIARECANVYLEICGSVWPRGTLERLVEGAGVERVVWGSDAYFMSQAHQLGKVLGATCDDAVKRQVLSTNARRILNAILP